MDTSRRQVGRITDTIGVIAVVIGMVLGLLPGVAVADHGTGPLGPGEFEIDGNIAQDNGAGGIHDFGLEAELPKDTVATGNASDANMFPSAPPSQKETSYPHFVIDAGEVPGKSDLERLFLDWQIGNHPTTTDHVKSYIWIGTSRVKDSGNTQVTAEFNQGKLQEADFEGNAYRHDGDLYIRFNFPGTSTEEPNVEVLRWDSSVLAPDGDTGWFVSAGSFPFRSKQGTITGGGGATRDFVEIEVDVTTLFFPSDVTTIPCDSFGTVSFRTESSGGNADNNEPVLKDFAGPADIELSTCAVVKAKKTDEGGNPLSGVTFTLYEDEALTTPVAGVDNPCVTGGDGLCTFGAVPDGTYWVDEDAGSLPEGYEKDESEWPKSVVVDVDEATVFVVEGSNPRIPYEISVTPKEATNALDESNPAASEHTFDVFLTQDGVPLAGEVVELDWDGAVGAIVEVNGIDVGPTNSTTCTTLEDDAGTTEVDEEGHCYVVVNTSAPGGGTLTASWARPTSTPTPRRPRPSPQRTVRRTAPSPTAVTRTGSASTPASASTG